MKKEKEETEFRATAKAHNKLGLDSIFLKSQEDIDLIKSALNERDFKLVLLMRGSKDGFEGKVFHEKCDD